MTSRADTAADHYSILGVGPDATFEEIRAAYRRKLRLWHPDLVADTTQDARQTATEMTAQLIEAYQCLSDPDRRAAYDRSSRVATASVSPGAIPVLVVSPRALRCDVTPGDVVRFSLEVRAYSPPGGDGPRVGTSDQLVAATFASTNLSAHRARVTLRADTSKLAAHRIYRIPIVVTWGRHTGTTTLVVRTNGIRTTGSSSTPRRPTSASRRHRARSPSHRVRDLTTIGFGGVVLPSFVMAWASGLLSAPPLPNASLVAAISAGVLATTAWVLTSSRLLRQPDRLGFVGVVWARLMRWLGWIVVGASAVFLALPAAALMVIAAIATPALGLVIVTIISGRSDSKEE